MRSTSVVPAAAAHSVSVSSSAARVAEEFED
jgi:hypothetical protein